MTEGSAALILHLVEAVVNGDNTALLTKFVAADYVGHDALGDHYGPEGARIVVAEYRTAFPDLAMTVEDLVAAGDTVAWRFTLRGTHAGPFMGIPPTGQAVTAAGIAIDRVADGLIVESWCSLDALGLLRQLGAGPALGRRTEPMPTDTASTPLGTAAL